MDVDRRYVVGRAQNGLVLLFSGDGESSSTGKARAPRASPCRFEWDMVPKDNCELAVRAEDDGEVVLRMIEARGVGVCWYSSSGLNHVVWRDGPGAWMSLLLQVTS